MVSYVGKEENFKTMTTRFWFEVDYLDETLEVARVIPVYGKDFFIDFVGHKVDDKDLLDILYKECLVSEEMKDEN